METNETYALKILDELSKLNEILIEIKKQNDVIIDIVKWILIQV